MACLAIKNIISISVLLLVFTWNVTESSFAKETTRNKTMDEVLQMIREYRNNFGYPPTFNDYESFIECLSPDIVTDNTPALIYNEILKQQQPKVSLSEIQKIIKTKRSAIRDVRIRYNIVSNEKIKPWNKQYSAQCEFASKDNKYYLDTNNISTNIRDKISYDGNIIRRLRQIEQLPNQGEIREGNNLSVFYDPWMPLTLAGLFDTQSCGVSNYSNDLVLFYMVNPLFFLMVLIFIQLLTSSKKRKILENMIVFLSREEPLVNIWPLIMIIL